MTLMPKDNARQAFSQIEVSMLFVHRANIERYKKLLSTPLSDHERLLIEGQIAEEERGLKALARNPL